MSDTQQQERGWVWLTLFVTMGLFNIIDFFYRGDTEIHLLLSGAGFLLLAPQAFMHPIPFTKPLWPQFKSTPRTSKPIDWLAMIGIAFLVASLIVRWV